MSSTASIFQKQQVIQNRWQLGERGGKIAITPTGRSEVLIDFGVEPEKEIKRKAIPRREKAALKKSKMPRFTNTRKSKVLQSMNIIQNDPIKDQSEIEAEKTIASYLKNIGTTAELRSQDDSVVLKNQSNKESLENIAAKVYKNASNQDKQEKVNSTT